MYLPACFLYVKKLLHCLTPRTRHSQGLLWRAVSDKSSRESEFMSRIGQSYSRKKIHVENRTKLYSRIRIHIEQKYSSIRIHGENGTKFKVFENRGETRALIGGGDIHMFVFCPTNFF